MCCIVQNEPNRTRHSQWWLLGDKRDEIITFNFQAKLSFLTIIDVNQSKFQIPDQESARKAKPGDPFTFTVDASKTGWGEVAIDVVFENESIRRTFYVEEVHDRIYQVYT